MAKARSPGYPGVGLPTAIEKIAMVYRADAQNSIPREVVAKHAGYSGINGNSLFMLSALAKYGLLEGRGDNTAVSDLAVQILAHAEGSEERRAAISEAAFKPKLFAEIRDHFKSGQPSENALRAFLLTRKFLPQRVDLAIRAYRDTMDLVDRQGAGYDAPEGGSGAADSKPNAGEVRMIRNQPPPPPPPAGTVKIMEGEREFMRAPLSPESNVRIIVSGPISARELKKLGKLIRIQELFHSMDKGEQDALIEELERDVVGGGQ
jgi:hypothetical protein